MTKYEKNYFLIHKLKKIIIYFGLMRPNISIYTSLNQQESKIEISNLLFVYTFLFQYKGNELKSGSYFNVYFLSSIKIYQ